MLADIFSCKILTGSALREAPVLVPDFGRGSKAGGKMQPLYSSYLQVWWPEYSHTLAIPTPDTGLSIQTSEGVPPQLGFTTYNAGISN